MPNEYANFEHKKEKPNDSVAGGFLHFDTLKTMIPIAGFASMVLYLILTNYFVTQQSLEKVEEKMDKIIEQNQNHFQDWREFKGRVELLISERGGNAP